MKKKLIVLVACMMFLLGGVAQASFLTVGPSNAWVPMSIGSVGGGDFIGSTLDGNALDWLYCVDTVRHITPGTLYNETVTTTDGKIYGVAVPNADKVAWLLSNYSPAGQTDATKALQAAIWTTVNPGATLLASASYLGTYNNILASLSAAGDPDDALIANFLWVSPGLNTLGISSTGYQGLITTNPVPIPAALWLLGSGLLGLVGLRRKFKA